jgi:hypothetical protein
VNYEISLQQVGTEWHWTLIRHNDAGAKVVADSFVGCASASLAAADAEAEIAEPGRALRAYRAAIGSRNTLVVGI